jgi:hypothetical protein
MIPIIFLLTPKPQFFLWKILEDDKCIFFYTNEIINKLLWLFLKLIHLLFEIVMVLVYCKWLLFVTLECLLISMDLLAQTLF